MKLLSAASISADMGSALDVDSFRIMHRDLDVVYFVLYESWVL